MTPSNGSQATPSGDAAEQAIDHAYFVVVALAGETEVE
jgi:hypothetical protein